MSNPQQPSNALVHLWIFNHPFYGISDQVEYFLMSLNQAGYKVSIGRKPRLDALNVVIENFSETTSRTLINFCSSSGKRVVVIMTEHLDFIKNKIYIHGDPMWNDNDYMNPVVQVARIKNLMDCVPYIRCFFVLGDLPELRNINDMFPGISVRTLPFPKIRKFSQVDLAKENKPTFDLAFTGYETSYRTVLMKQLEENMSLTFPGKFVSRKMRDEINRSAKIVLNLPQRKDWKWLSLMRIVAALRCGRATISLGTADNSKISACCIQLDISKRNWVDGLREYVSKWDTTYQIAFENYETMAIVFEKEKPFPHDIFDYWAVTEQGMGYNN